jgi:hypothetical protein
MKVAVHVVLLVAVAASLAGPRAGATEPVARLEGSLPGAEGAHGPLLHTTLGPALATGQLPRLLDTSAEPFLITSLPGVFTGPSVATIVGADRFYAAGFTGQSTIATNIEAGHVWAGHESLTHVTSRANATGVPVSPFVTPAYDAHATAVGMMIGGRAAGPFAGTYQTGIAPQTDLRSGAIATSFALDGSFGMSLTSMAVPYASAVSGFGTADVINSSWGGTSDWNGKASAGMDSRSLITDGLADDNPRTTFVVAAGNAGSGANTVGAPAAGYNNIAVAALQNDGLNGYSSVASFSSRGPQDYGDASGTIAGVRAAIDIAAPGTNLTTAFYGGQTGGNDASLAGSDPTFVGLTNLYVSNIAGTSFAAPIVAGGVALMKSAAKAEDLPATALDTRVVKAALQNAATKIPGWNNGQVAHANGNGGVRTTQSLDWASGAGALDLDRTFDQYLSGQTDIAGLVGGATAQTLGWDYAAVARGAVTDVVVTQPLRGGSEFRATLVWFRERDYVSPTTQIDAGFANLDLQIWDASFTTLYSESSSLYNSVEHLAFSLPVTGLYGIRVHYAANVFGSLESEEFALAWSAVAVPEPSTWALAVAGLAVASLAGRRRTGVQ